MWTNAASALMHGEEDGSSRSSLGFGKSYTHFLQREYITL